MPDWFGGWDRLGGILVGGTLVYASVVALLRIFGKRTLAKLNAFDFVVAIALGSVMASTAFEPWEEALL